VTQAASLAIFVVGLGFGIAVGLPLIAFAAIGGGLRFDERVRDAVHRRISFGVPATERFAAGRFG
jgi:hypothetical protein